jgi:lipid-A-disaccharide synthase
VTDRGPTDASSGKRSEPQPGPQPGGTGTGRRPTRTAGSFIKPETGVPKFTPQPAAKESNAPASAEPGEHEPAHGDDRRKRGAILFTAFEPSGDAHAAPVIAELKARDPGIVIYAWGGPKMEEAGATLISSTCDDGAMGLDGFKKIAAVRSEHQKLKRWSTQHRVAVHVPVDSPAANFPVAQFLKPRGVRVAHLVAPQLWAWGPWRAKKLRACTDCVMCLLPFEEQWFKSRQIPAKFIGHPVINRELDRDEVNQRMRSLPSGSPKILLLPGSRSSEVSRNIRLLVGAFIELSDRNRGTAGLIVAANERLARQIRERVVDMPIGLHVVVGEIDAGVAWCDIALTVSGTVSLDLTRQHRPMVGVYRTGLISWLGAKIMLRTPHRLLPNILAGRRIVPEFVPAPPWISPRTIVEAATPFLKDSKNMAIAAEELRRVAQRFQGRDPAHAAADIILRLADGRPAEDPKPAVNASPTVDPV